MICSAVFKLVNMISTVTELLVPKLQLNYFTSVLKQMLSIKGSLSFHCKFANVFGLKLLNINAYERSTLQTRSQYCVCSLVFLKKEIHYKLFLSSNIRVIKF